MKKQKIIITIMTLLAVTLIVSPTVWAKNDNNSGVPFQALWDAINILQTQIDEIDLIPGPPGESAKVVTQVEKRLNLKTFPTSSTMIGSPIEVTISEPTDIVVLFTAEVVPPYVTDEVNTGSMSIYLVCHQNYGSIVSEEWYTFSGNGLITPRQQANIHSVITISEPGDYIIEYYWSHYTPGNGVYEWTMKDYRKTLIIP
jgi:hypothetical protein